MRRVSSGLYELVEGDDKYEAIRHDIPTVRWVALKNGSRDGFAESYENYRDAKAAVEAAIAARKVTVEPDLFSAQESEPETPPPAEEPEEDLGITDEEEFFNTNEETDYPSLVTGLSQPESEQHSLR